MSNNITDLFCLGNAVDAVTVLTVKPGRSATKTFQWDGSTYEKIRDFNAGMWFSHEEYKVSSIQDLSYLLVALEASQVSFIIRGGLTLDAPSKDPVRRMKHPDEDGNVWFNECPRRWLMIDIDDIELPDWADPVSDPECIASFLVDQLPECFHGVTCHWQMSSSAGVKPTAEARAHLWFWLDRALGEVELKRWTAGFGIKTDPAVYRTVQPLYVARPTFLGGPDPLPRRSGLMTKDFDVVAVPKIDMTIMAKTSSSGISHELDAAPGYENKMALLGDGDGLQGFHAPITSAIAAYVSEYGADFDKEALKSDISRRIDAATKSPSRGSNINRYKSDGYLDPSIDGAIKRYGTPKKVPALYRPPEGDLDEARNELREAVDLWQGEAINYIGDLNNRETRLKTTRWSTPRARSISALFNSIPIPPVHGIEAGTGIGKSHEMRKTLEVLIWGLSSGHCIFIAVPNHNLSEEMANAIKSQGISAVVYRGLSAQDPDSPKNSMCRIAADAEALRRGGSKMSDLCNECPHVGVCGWQRQHKLEAQVWVGAHNLLFHPRPDPITDIDYVIVDESPISVGLNGFSNTDTLSVSPSELRHRAQYGDKLLGNARNKLADAIENGSTNESIIKRNFGLYIGTEIRKILKLVYAEMTKINVHGGLSKKALLMAIGEANYNRRLLIEVEIWNALGNLNNAYPIPGLRIENSENSDGVPEHRLRLRQRRNVHSDFQNPTLLLDATPNWGAYQMFWDISQTTRVEAALPHVNFRQITWSAARAKLLTDTKTANNNCKRMLHYIESRASNYRKVLVLSQMGLEKKLRELLPENVQISHFNALRGLDLWGDVDCLIVIGRTQPPPSEVEMQAEVIFDTVPDSLGDTYYSKKDVELAVTNVDVNRSIKMEYHPDNKSEAMRWLICEAELIQAIGRARGVNRTEINPLQIDIIGTVPLPFKIDEVMSLDEAKPDPLEIMAGRGVALNCDPSEKGASKVISAMLPDLYSTPDAVKSARRRSRCQTPNRYILLGKRHRESNKTDRWRSDLLKLADSRYAVPVLVRRRLWRPLRSGETPPANARGSILDGVTYVLEPLLPEEFRENAGYILKK
jgi:hypothetical protein